jgi:methoxymalonate biosynthesis acyl carrier protein
MVLKRKVTMDEHKRQIREFFSRFFQSAELADTDDIFASGYVNSLFAMQLIAWLEKEFVVAIEDTDLQVSNFNSVSAIAGLLERKAMRTTAA